MKTTLRTIVTVLVLSRPIVAAQTSSIAATCFQTQGPCTALNAPDIANPPVITLSGSNPLVMTVGGSYIEPGYTGIDDQDGDITSRVRIAGFVNAAVAGTYTLTYTATDLEGLSAVPRTRTIIVTSATGSTTTYPLTSTICSVVWLTNVYYNYGQHDADMRVGGYGDWYDSLFACNFSGMPTTATKVILRLYSYTSNGGTHGQMYFDRVTSTWSNLTKWQSMPSIMNLMTLPAPVDNQWVEIDITALYNSWQNGTFPNYGIMLRPVSNNNVYNFFRSTEYSDTNLRPQLVVTTESVVPNTAPTISLSGSNPLLLNVGNIYTEPGYSVTDYEDGNITSKVTISGSVNTSAAGTYTLTYTVKDSGGLSASATRIVIVSAVQTPPFSASCAVNGSLNPITIQTGTTVFYGAGWTGGTGTIHFFWSGASGGDISNASQAYNASGSYIASVRVTDSGSPIQQATAACPQVTVSAPVVPALSGICSFSPSSIRLGASTSYVVSMYGGYPPYTYYLPGTITYQSGASAISTVTPGNTGTQPYTGIVQDSHGQVVKPTCSVTVTP